MHRQMSEESESRNSGSPGASAVGSLQKLFGWIFCAGQTLSRDEDLFSNLQALTKDDEGNDLDASICPKVFTCCVGKTLSQASYRIADTSEVASLLDLLANVSADEHAQPSADEVPQPPLPSSTLERLKELLRELEGKQLIIILDFEDAAAMLADPSPVVERLLSLYPVAVVQRTPWTAPLHDALEASERDQSLRSSGLGLSSKDLFSMAERAERAATITKSDLFSTNQSTAAAALEALGSISGVQIVSFGRQFGGLGSARAAGGGASGGAESGEMVVEQVVDSFRPALESCLQVLQSRFGTNPQITIEDNTFSLTVSHRGVEEVEVVEEVRSLVDQLLEEDYPMLRSDAGERTQIHVRPDPGWTRTRMVGWIVNQVVDAVEEKLQIKNKHRAMPIYLGEDPSFRHLHTISGLDILITSGPSIDGYYLRYAQQVEQLLGWLNEQHAAGVTVRGGRIKSKASTLQKGAALTGGPPPPTAAGVARSAMGAGGTRPAAGKRVQISMDAKR